MNKKSILAIVTVITVFLSSIPMILIPVAADNPSNLVEYIDFGDDYAAGSRDADGIPNWRYFTNGKTSSDGRTYFLENAIEIQGIANSGNSYANRAVLLANDRSVVKIDGGKRYKLVFDLLLRGEELSTRTVDIRFGSALWSEYSGYVHPIPASEMTLEATSTDGDFQVYTISTIVTAPVSQNMELSVYGNGNNSAARIKNVYIYKTFTYTCKDKSGNKVGILDAFPGEALADLIPNSEIDKHGYFETPVSDTVPLSPSDDIVIDYQVDKSFVSFTAFDNDYGKNGAATKYFIADSAGNVNTHKLVKDGQRVDVSANSNTVSDNFRYRSCVISNDYANSGLTAGKKYVITFELTCDATTDISVYNLELRSGRYAGTGLSGTKANAAVYTGEQLKNYVTKLQKTSTGRVYTLTVPYTLATDSDFGTYTERNILMSIFGGNKACSFDNIEISLSSDVILNNTDLGTLSGKIGYPLTLPENPIKKGNVFIAWYEDSDFNKEFKGTTFGDTDMNVYAKYEEVPLTAEMNFSEAPITDADMTGFTYNSSNGNIFADTLSSATAYIKVYNSGKTLRISPLDYYPLSLRYKTEGYTGKVTFGIASAAENDFNLAKNVLTSVKVNQASDFKTVQMVASPENITEDGVTGDYLYFFVTYDKQAGGKIFVDDIVIKQETSVSFNTMGGNAISKMSGVPGETFKLPTPVKSGSSFTGWYYDEALTVKVNGTNITYPTATCEMALYASWDKASAPITTDGIESYTNAEIENSANESLKNVFSVSNSIAHTGNASMRYRFDPTTTKSLAVQTSSFKLKGNSGASLKGITIEQGKTYVMTFYVYAKELETTVDFTAFTAKGESVLTNGAKVSTTSGIHARIGSHLFPKNEWKKVTYVFKSAQTTTGADELFLGVKANSSKFTELYVDDISLEELGDDRGAVAYTTAVYNTTLVELEHNFAVGKIGEAVVTPKGYRENYLLEGWYTTYRYSKEFVPTFEAGVKAAYPQWDISGEVKISMENVADFQRDGPGTSITNKNTNFGGGEVVVGQQASDGKAAYKFDGANNAHWEKGLALKESDGSPFRLVNGKSYIVMVDIFVEKLDTDFVFNFTTGSQDNYYAWRGSTTGAFNVNGDVPQGKWLTTALTVNASFDTYGGFNLFFRHTASGSDVVYFDNFRILPLDPDKPTVLINKGLIAGSVDVITGEKGQPYSLPRNVEVDGYDFAGWYSSPALTKPIDFDDVFLETKTVYAKMLPKKYVNGFEDTGYDFATTWGGDMDYEIYDKNVAGNSADNVHGGNKSLHRIGNDYQHKNVVIARKTATISTGEAYELSMWVKMDKYDHTDGAIKIASCSSSRFAWDLIGDMRAVVPIKDLTDGNWHYVTYKFMSSAYFLSLQTPGYCSIYIDDVTITHLSDPVTPVSPEYKEYVPLEKDANGKIPAVITQTEDLFVDNSLSIYEEYQKLIDKYDAIEDDDYDEDEAEDESQVVNASKKVKKKQTTVTAKRNPLTFKDILTCNSYTWYTVVFYSAVAGVLVIAAGVVLLIVLKKRKKGGKR